MKYFLLLSILFSFSAMSGTDIQNGGGGISVNGTVATFYSATLQVYPESRNPQLKLSTLERLIRARQISNKAKIELLENISDSYGRKYYAVNETALSEEVMASIKAEYHRVTNIPLENLTIFAVTDPKSKITLILPDFYRLTPAEQFSILFHESLWINGRVTSYERMLEIDKASQIYFEFSNSCEAIYNFTSQLEALFNGSNWALNDGVDCEVNKYRDLLGIERAPIADFIDAPTRYELAKLLLVSYYYYPYQHPHDTATLVEYLESDLSRVFNISRLGLARKIKSGGHLQVIFERSVLEQLKNNGLPSTENVEILAKLLEQKDFNIPFKTDSFTMNFLGIGIANFL